MSAKTLIDFRYLEEVSGNDQEFIRQMIEVFLEQSPLTITSLREAFNSRNWPKVSMSAHSLKTSLRLMGVHEPVEMVVKLEHLAKEQEHLDQIPDLVEFTTQLVQDCIMELEASLDNQV